MKFNDFVNLSQSNQMLRISTLYNGSCVFLMECVFFSILLIKTLVNMSFFISSARMEKIFI